MLYCIVLYCIVSYRIVSCRVVLYCIVLYCIVCGKVRTVGSVTMITEDYVDGTA